MYTHYIRSLLDLQPMYRLSHIVSRTFRLYMEGLPPEQFSQQPSYDATVIFRL